jgi:hypothetical protein
VSARTDDPGPSADLRARVLAAARAEPAPPRAAGRRRNALVIAGALVLPVVLSALVHGPDAGGRPCGYVVALAAAWLMVSALATWGGVLRGQSMLGRPASWRVVVATLTPVALLVTAAMAALVWPQTMTDDAGPRHHVVCIVFTFLNALGPLVAFALIRRRSDPVAPRLTGGAIGAAAASWGALSVELHCGHASPGHVLIGHLMPVVLLTLIGVAVGHFVVAIRARA